MTQHTRTLEDYIIRQIVASRLNFGPAERTEGLIEHIRKELDEIRAETHAAGRAKEWVDVVILGLDGLTRAIRHGYSDGKPRPMSADMIAKVACNLLTEKQHTNETRDWPDWRTMGEDQAIEHVRD